MPNETETTTDRPPGRYQHRGTLGCGGSGEVFAAWDSHLGRTVAIKRIRTTGVHEDALQSGLHEAMRLATLRHASIVSVYDLGVEDGAPFIVMEHVQGETLDVRVSRGPLGVQEFAEFARQTLSGLTAAHQAGLVHRDLKPGNIMLTPQPCGGFQVKILDFGLSKFVEGPSAQTLNRDGTLSGSIHYISPEQLNQDPVDARSDLYSIGCVFYFALTGKKPFIGETLAHVVGAHLTHHVLPIGSLRPDLPEALALWLMRLISRSPEDRPQTALRALDELEAALPFTARLLAPTVPAEEQTKAGDTVRVPVAELRAMKRRSRLLVGLGAAALVMAGVFMWRFGQEKPAAPMPAFAPAVAKIRTPEAVVPAATPEPVPTPAPVLVAAATPVPVPVAAPTPVPATLAPVEPPPKAEVVFRVHGSNTIGAKLMPALMEDFLKREGATKVHRVPGENHEEQSVEFVPGDGGALQAFRIEAHGSNTAVAGLVADHCDLGMRSSPIKPEEIAAAEAAGLGNMHSAECEHVIGLDGLAILVHKDNSVSQLTKQQVSDIFAGRIADWSAVGGKAGPIHCYARDPKSGTHDSFRAMVLGQVPLATGTREYEDSTQLSADCAADPAGIGFVGLPFIGQCKALAIYEGDVTALLPTRFTVATEDYLLSRRLFLYAPARPQNPWTARFLNYVLSDAGQEVVSKAGFVKQTIDLHKPVMPPGAPETYLKTVSAAERLSLDFRFQPSSAAVDNKGVRDLDRLAALLTEGKLNGRPLMLLGFSDNTGIAATNVKLAKERAEVVARELLSRGVQPSLVTGIGPILPVASNETADGRHKNRRVEVWLREAERVAR
jgi:phosphate transport system substrate-binding protein